MIRIPDGFVSRVAGREPDVRNGTDGIDGDSWLAALPQLAARHLEQWELTVDGDPWYGENGLVLPVTRRTGQPAALKLTWPHDEARTEHLALRAWGGRGAVSLLGAAPADFRLLLERLDGDRELTTVPIEPLTY